MKHSFLLFCFCLFSLVAWAQAAQEQKIIPGRRNSPAQQQKPYVILISVDGFRYDYAQKYHATTLLRLSNEGVKAASMIPSYPSVTFPNHYTIVTGMYPAHHGLVYNRYYDRQRRDIYTMKDRRKVEDGSRYGGTPLWVLAEQQQMLSASFFWVGSEAPIQGISPTYYYNYTEKYKIDERIQTVVNWLQLPPEQRPHLITLYFPEVDHAGHWYGPDDPRTQAAVLEIDTAIQKLTDAVAATGLPVNYVLVSDHGMTNINRDQPITLPAAVDTANFIIPEGGTLVNLYAKNKAAIKPAYAQLKQQQKGFRVYLKKDLPRRWRYGTKDDYYNRVGDIILVADWPNVFHFSKKKPDPGTHGFDPAVVKDMHATFYAWGPAFKKQVQLPAFQNIHVFPVITELLGLDYRHKIDGKKKLAKQILVR